MLTKLEDLKPEDWATMDVVFCCLPHATTQEIIASLPASVKV
jgi:N-acetyl-gamma-glutamyl-phosphate reductase